MDFESSDLSSNLGETGYRGFFRAYILGKGGEYFIFFTFINEGTTTWRTGVQNKSQNALRSFTGSLAHMKSLLSLISSYSTYCRYGDAFCADN
ncbi:unnamed protein product [Allacma fusca]|uniref:Uncharacterized protein n=1 Tax=Allacma fusca TaxID=39272 RepID=A0A8J2KCL1_9HEXA|nr:unnamed protein product [Allacma fusca]